MSDGGTVWIWTAAILAGSVGFAVGYLVAYLAVLRDQDAGALREQLARQQQEFDAHRNRVDDHFVRTSELFQDMTRQYGALYEHLANGAQSLCSDRLVTHRPRVPENTPMVEHKRDAASATTAVAGSDVEPVEATTPAAATEPPATGAGTDRNAEHDNDNMHVQERQKTEAAAVEESELESFAPRPEAAQLRDSTSVSAAPAGSPAETEDKPRLH